MKKSIRGILLLGYVAALGSAEINTLSYIYTQENIHEFEERDPDFAEDYANHIVDSINFPDFFLRYGEVVAAKRYLNKGKYSRGVAGHFDGT